MHRVLIVDDEPLVCSLVCNLVDWGSLGMEVAGKCLDGYQALDMIEKLRPDIVVSDIKMPGLDGLELIRTTQKRGIKTSFILISGHKDFEFAHKAIKYGVENYILKPIGKQELEAALKKVRDKIEAERKTYAMMAQNQKISEDNAKMSRVQLLYSFIVNQLPKTACSPVEIRNMFSVDLPGDRFRLITVYADAKESLPVESRGIVCQKILELIPEEDKESGSLFISGEHKERVLILVNYRDEGRAMVKRAIQCLFERFRKELFAYCYITLGVSSAYALLDNRMLDESMDALCSRMQYGFDKVLYFNPDVPVHHQDTQRERSALTALLDNIENANIEGIENIFQEIQAAFAGREYRSVVSFMQTIISEANRCFSKMFSSFSETCDGIAAPEDVVVKAKSKNELFQCVKRYIHNNVNIFLDKRSSSSSQYIRIAKQYICDHFPDKIHLEDVANSLYLNPTYFSVIFKREEGMNFSNYLVRYRMDKAKQLLQQTMIPINIIGKQVGYEDPRYFSQLFQKTIGIKPSEYRRLYR